LDPETKALKRSPHADPMSLGGYRTIRKQLFLTGVPIWNGIDDPHAMRIEDARGCEAEFTLDRNGFALVKAPTAVAISIRPSKSSGFTIQKSSCARSWAPAAYSSSTTVWAMPGGRARPRRSAGSSTITRSFGAAAGARSSRRRHAGTAAAPLRSLGEPVVTASSVPNDRKFQIFSAEAGAAPARIRTFQIY
jgi:hypothetical protein